MLRVVSMQLLMALNNLLYGNQVNQKAESKSKGKGKETEKASNTLKETSAIARFSPLSPEDTGGLQEPGPSSGHVRKAQHLFSV